MDFNIGKELPMIYLNFLQQNFGKELNIIKATEALTRANVRQKVILMHGCTIKAETAIILNTGLIMIQKQKLLLQLKCLWFLL